MLNQVDPAVIVQIDARTFVERKIPRHRPAHRGATAAVRRGGVTYQRTCVVPQEGVGVRPARVANPEVEIAVALFIKCHNRAVPRQGADGDLNSAGKGAIAVIGKAVNIARTVVITGDEQIARAVTVVIGNGAGGVVVAALIQRQRGLRPGEWVSRLHYLLVCQHRPHPVRVEAVGQPPGGGFAGGSPGRCVINRRVNRHRAVANIGVIAVTRRTFYLRSNGIGGRGNCQRIGIRQLYIPGVVRRIDHYRAARFRGVGFAVDHHFNILPAGECRGDHPADNRRGVARGLVGNLRQRGWNRGIDRQNKITGGGDIPRQIHHSRAVGIGTADQPAVAVGPVQRADHRHRT